MHLHHTTRVAGAARRVALSRSAALLAAALLGACKTDDLTSVNTPDVVTPTSVSSASALPAVYGAAIGEFGVAFQGSSGTEGQILYGGLVSDEILLSDTFDTRRKIDARNLSIDFANANNETVFRQLQIARAAAERAGASYRQYQNFAAAQAEVYALAGYTYLFFAEHYCGGVPFSTLNPDGTVTSGAPNSTAQMLALASAKFDSAIVVTDSLAKISASLVATQAGLARIGKGRALTDLGQYAAAAAAVVSVPVKFAYTLASSTNTTRQNNGVWSFNRNQRRFTAVNREGGNGLPYISDADPRVLTVLGSSTALASRVGFDAATPFYTIVKYSEQASSAVLANGIEGQLIQAEAAYNAGNTTQMLSILNTLRADPTLYACPTGITLTNFTCPTTTPTLAPLTDPGSDLGRLQLLFKERAYWLYVTGHRLGDQRRLARLPTSGLSAYGDKTGGVNAVFPVGNYTPQAGTTYGTNVTLSVPYSETTVNTQFTQAACNVNAP